MTDAEYAERHTELVEHIEDLEETIELMRDRHADLTRQLLELEKLEAKRC
jgi:hypothetical protein